ncbi:MAG: hypothetical protein TREMPRED_003069 [Tremellales sp. Tagirdzhanova-0007]|nr:MAG: hypothetical protein TREMPRED_003069 [Tremellales sp. Tagirdzhanova-0007]
MGAEEVICIFLSLSAFGPARASEKHILKSALIESGYKTVDDVLQVSAGDLCVELAIGTTQAEDILRHAEHSRRSPNIPTDRQERLSMTPTVVAPWQDTSSSPSKRSPTLLAGPPSSDSHVHSSTAAELLSTAALPHFSTLCTSLDRLISHFGSDPKNIEASYTRGKGKGRLLEGGITPGMAIELCGPPGGGKSAISIGIALSARLGNQDLEQQQTAAGLGEVLVIDTEGAITPDRVYKAAASIPRQSSSQYYSIRLSPQSVISGIHIIRIATQVQMIAFLNTMDEWLNVHPKVNLVIIDTLSFHFRQPNLEIRTRSRIMELVKLNIASATTIHRCAVIVTNQLATKLMTADGKPANFDTADRAILMPQLGDSWTTVNTVRIVLFRGGPGDDLRYAHAASSLDGKEDLPWANFDFDVGFFLSATFLID